MGGGWSLLGRGHSAESYRLNQFDLEAAQAFPEGAEKSRLHLLRERNQMVVRMAKAPRAPAGTRCCTAPFARSVSRKSTVLFGTGFIEAHHQMPVAQLKAGSLTRIEDIVLVCPNCHNMLHRGTQLLTVQELQTIRGNARTTTSS